MKNNMTLVDWAQCQFLKRDHGNWGDWHKISRELIHSVDELCFQEGLMPLVTSGTGGKHSEKSFHYKGEALDVMFFNIELHELPRVFQAAVDSPNFTGVGLYSEWRLSHNTPPRGGLHLERDGVATIPVARKKLWVRTSDGDFAPTKEVIQKYFLTKKL